MTQDQFETIIARLDRIEKKLSTQRPSGGARVADDRDLDGQYGNPVVRKDPPRWDGDSFVGCKFSECSPEYLDAVVSFKLWQANKEVEKATDESEKKAHFLKKDASRAAGWAQRIRNGYQAETPAPTQPDDGDVPF